VDKLSCSKTARVVFLLCAVAVATSSAQTFTVLVNLDGSNGRAPYGGLVQGLDGSIYGTTAYGGANNSCSSGCGSVFRITLQGTLTTLYSFCASASCHDGYSPLAGLVLATNGNFYGTTAYGGANNSCTNGCGTVFKITPQGALTTLYSFCASAGCPDGYSPDAELVQGVDGSFYGTTAYGGAYKSCNSSNGCGTVFKITPQGTLTTLHTFCASADCADGEQPSSAMVQGSDGSFYGTTGGGGAYGLGTIFKITPQGTLTTLYSFCASAGCPDGGSPGGAMVQGADGSFYGTTTYGGSNNVGTVFKITPTSKLTTLYSFTSIGLPSASAEGLVQGSDGNFYGATFSDETVFRITPAGNLTTLRFFSWPDGVEPTGLVQGTDGNFYGTTNFGGASGDGTIYRMSMGPFVKTLPTSGRVGATIKILGTDLTGTTDVSFDGTTSTFTVVSATEITATVPTGATTGNVLVITPGGWLQSIGAFRVMP
jgi:uncharacterized repeat protein (TIGR03803 family)